MMSIMLVTFLLFVFCESLHMQSSYERVVNSVNTFKIEQILIGFFWGFFAVV